MQSPNITVGVPKRWFHTTNSTLTPSMSISTSRTRPWLIRDQWSMVNTIFDTLKWNQMDLYNQNLIPTIHSHAAQKVGLNSFPPNSAPIQTAFHISNPTNLCTLSSILWFLRFPTFGELGVGLNGRGLDLESVQSQNKGKWAEQLGRRWEKESMLSQCLMMVVKVFVVAILF